MYQTKKSELAKELQQNQEQELKSPKIDEVSKRIVANMNRPAKIEERLFQEAQRIKLEQEKKKKEALELAKKTAKPDISKTSKAIAQTKNEDGSQFYSAIFFQRSF